MKHIKKLSMLMIVVLAVAICGSFPSEVFAGKVLKGTLSGIVVDQNGKPISNTQVQVYQRDWTNTDGLGMPDWKALAGKTITGRNGQYKIALPAGEYKVMFVPSNLDLYAMEAYPDAPIVRLGDSITIRYGKTTGGISAKLDPPGKISGYIFDADSQAVPIPMADTPISLCIQDYSIKNCIQLTSTDENGYYEFKGLKAYPWEVWVNCPQFALPGENVYDVPNYKTAYKNYFRYAFGPCTWLPIAGETSSVENIFLENLLFVNISGTLKYFDEQSQELKPVAGMTVRAEFADDPMNIQDWGSEYYEDITDENGAFEISGFGQAFGVFILRVDGTVGGNQLFYDEYYDNSQNQWGAMPTDLVSGYPVTGIEWMIDWIPEGQNP